MTLHELNSSTEIDVFQRANPNTLICFSATWCGPCKASKPTLIALAAEYESDPSTVLAVGIVYEHNLGDELQKYNVKAFPTYVLFENHGTKEVGRVSGANFDSIRALVAQSTNVTKTFGSGEGQSLGGGGVASASSAEEMRKQRLARMEAAAAASSAAAAAAEATPPTPPVEDEKPKAMDTEEDDDAAAAATKKDKNDGGGDVDMKDAANENEDDDGKKDGIDAEMVDPTLSLDKTMIETLTSSMGFSLIRAQKGLLHGGQTTEGAVEWLLAHQEDSDIDDPIPKIPISGPGTAQSYKCNECGRVLANMANLELHANKTGHSDFEESTTAIKPLTQEEKAIKLKQLKSLLVAKRSEREEEEKTAEIDREKQRRFMGKEMAKTREQMEMEKRKRDAKQRKREKDAFRRERERIKAELAKDKAERIANKGKLKSRLGADGYNPDAIQYNVSAGGGPTGSGEGGGEAAAAAEQEKEASKVKSNKTKLSTTMKVDQCISKVSQYRAGGDGGKCLKILHIYVKNVVENPTEDKYRTVNMENKTFKAKVKPFIGGKQLLLAVGFAPNKGGDALVLGDDADMMMLQETKVKLEEALTKYG